jgi:MFS family permease
VASARIWGKRHLFLLGMLILIASCAWGGATHKSRSYKSMLWARIFQGVATAPFEALTNACVGDLYFVHERGTRMALTNVALFGGAFLTPVFVGHISATMGWQWTFYFIAIFGAASFPLLFFFVPETAYVRAAHLNTDIELETYYPKSQEHLNTDIELETNYPKSQEHLSSAKDHSAAVSTTSPTSNPSGKTSYLKTLSPFNGRKTDESFLKILIRPFPLFIHPAIIWACLIQGVIIGWTVFVGVVIAAVYLGPPLFFNEVQTGNLYTGAFIGSIIGLILSGFLSDRINKVMIRWNRGKYEPEFRILLVLPMLVFCAIGLYGFGITANNATKYGWLIPDVFLAFILIGMVMGAVASACYLVDSHRQLSVEAFTCMLVFKNLFSFILTYFAFNWIFAGGIRKIFIIIGSVQVAICLLSIPMYILGKRNRSFFYRHDILRLTHLQ